MCIPQCSALFDRAGLNHARNIFNFRPAFGTDAIAGTRSLIIIDVVDGADDVELAIQNSRRLQVITSNTLSQHIEDIIGVVNYANELDIEVNVYLEDWSNGMKDSPEYVFQIVDALKETSIKRFMLPDTLGVLNPLQVIEFMRKMKKRYPDTHFDFHAHNDYDLAVSNVLAAVLSGVKGLHTTINGLGERAGNAPLASVQAILKDHFNAITNIDESRLNDVSRVVESYSGIVIPANKPIVGENVFTQVAGVHADGDNKSNLYCNDLLPERFGRIREYALGKTSGKANIRKNLESLGLELDEESMRKVTERIIELGDKSLSHRKIFHISSLMY